MKRESLWCCDVVGGYSDYLYMYTYIHVVGKYHIKYITCKYCPAVPGIFIFSDSI